MSTEVALKDYVNALGKRIKALREAQNLTQVEFANKCNFEKTALSRIEQGRTNPNLKTLLIISRSLNMDISDLLKLDE